ncbi:MAG: PAS domain S-box protein [Saprospiraceae bacterium]|nr:PAS domain S-box protein [Saprospiraceae bacterium]
MIKLENLISLRLNYLDSLHNIFETGGLNPENTLVYMNQGRVIMEQIKTSISNMRNTENAFYESKYNNSTTFTQTARTVITIFSISSLLIIIFTFYILFKNQNDIADREMKYRRIFELSPDIIYQLDKNLIISEISPAITEQLGYKSETLINSNLGELFQEEKNTKFIEKTIKRGLSISNMEITLKHLDGRSISFLLNLYADNSTKSFQGSLINITERIRREREKNALEKFAGIGKIARIIAHEVRNPLTNINLSVDSLKNNADQTEINDFLEIIENNSKRINKLITELLYTTKVNINTSIPLSVNAVLDNTLELAKDRIKLKGITLPEKL